MSHIFKNKAKYEKGSILVITIILISFLMILLGGLTTSLFITFNSNMHINNQEQARIESSNNAYSYYNKIVDGTYFLNEEEYTSNIKMQVVDTDTIYFVYGYDLANTFKTTLKVLNDAPVYTIASFNIEGVK